MNIPPLHPDYKRGKSKKAVQKEENGVCWSEACLKVLPEWKRKFCDDDCSLEYWSHFSWPFAKEYIYKRDGNKCTKCGAGPTKQSPLEIDHIVPISKGGERLEHSNLRLLCKPCHRAVTREQFGRSG